MIRNKNMKEYLMIAALLWGYLLIKSTILKQWISFFIVVICGILFGIFKYCQAKWFPEYQEHQYHSFQVLPL
jgi:hypothetical protein